MRLLIFFLSLGTLVWLRPDTSLADASALGGIIFLFASPARCAAGAVTILLWLVAFPPFSLATYWICFALWSWIWRQPPAGYSGWRCFAEALLLGMVLGWIGTGLARDSVPHWAALVHGFGCGVFGAQLAIVALSIWWMRHQPPGVAAIACALVAMGVEFLQARCLSAVAWLLTSLSLPAASAPVGQLARYATPFGVAGILYLCNFLWMPEFKRVGWARWRSTTCAALVLASSSAIGIWIRSQVLPTPLNFTAMIVQPHWRQGPDSSPGPWTTLDKLTRSSLREQGPVDLLIWPENSLVPGTQQRPRPEPAVDGPLHLQEFEWNVTHEYGAAGLAGVVLWRTGTELKYGLEVPCRRAYNCACLVSRSGATECQEKFALMPFREQLPSWLDHPWVRNEIMPFFGFEPFLTSGTRLRMLEFKRQEGGKAVVVAPICYESYLPWLPHYRGCDSADAIVHLTYDGDFADRPEYAARQTLACQYRAIETRKWTLLCTTWRGSAVIDPCGRVLARLDGAPGVLRTDRIQGTNLRIGN
jgi:apolipoprotein N-acyltransferase